MTRNAGQITPSRAIAAGLVFAALVIGLVSGLDLLLDAGEREPPLAAPAAATSNRCPDPDRPPGSPPARVTAGELIECPRSYDGRVVRYQGEAVRAVLRRADRAWVHLNDDPYGLLLGPLPEHRTAVGGNSGIAVSISSDLADAIVHVGDHRAHGDQLAVTGVFHRADPADGGAPTIQAQTARIIQPGRATAAPLAGERVATGLALTLAACVAAALAHRRRRQG